MSNRLFQGVIHQMRDAIDRTIGVVDETSVIIACSELGRIGEVNDNITAEVMATPSTFVLNGYTYRSFGTHPRPEYAVFVSGNDPEAGRYASLLAVSLNSIKQYYDEKYDRGNFIKNVILDNILPGDIYLKARELRFNSDVSRVCMLIKVTNKTDVSAYDVIQNLFPDKNEGLRHQHQRNRHRPRQGDPRRHRPARPRQAGRFHRRHALERVLHALRRRHRHHRHGHQGSGAFLQGSAGGAGGRQGVRHRKDHRQLRQPRHRAPDLSAAHHAVRDVPQGSLQARFHRVARPRDAVHHPALLREQPQRLRDVAASCSSTATRSSTASRRSRRSRASTCASSRTPSCSRWPSWSRNTSRPTL